MKREKESFGEWFDRSVRNATATLATIIAVIFAAVFWGWLGVFLVLAGVTIVAYLKGTGQIPDKWGE